MDRLRTLALLDIVAFHVHPTTHDLGGFGLPIFLLFTVALNARREVCEPTGRFIARKAAALLPPFIAWSLVYAGLHVATAARYHHPPFDWFRPSMLFTGPAGHLWYVPFVLLGGIAGHLVHRVTIRLPAMVVILGGAAAGAALVAELHWHEMHHLPVLGAWAFALPALPFGLAMGRCLVSTDRAVRTWRLAAMAAVSIAGCLATWVAWRDMPGLRYAIGLGLAALAAALPGRPDRVTTVLTDLRFGIYLVHPMFIRYYAALTRGWHLGWLELVLVLAVSGVVTALIRATPLRAIVSMRERQRLGMIPGRMTRSGVEMPASATPLRAAS